MRLRHLTLATLGLLLLCAHLDARAEVAARTNRQGKYVMTHVLPSGSDSNPQIWASRRGRIAARSLVALNPNGDLNGDLWPTVAESPSPPYHPWVVWSRPDDGHLRMAWSRWDRGNWTPIQFVESKADETDQLDARVAFDEDSRPFVVWWSQDETGRGRVWLSVFLATRWMEPFAVSDASIDASLPDVRFDDHGYLNVDFDTPDGRVSQLVMFSAPVTITDDINPQGRLWLKGRPQPMQEN